MSKELENYKTLCCNAKWYRKGKGNCRCEKCDKDVTLDLMLIYQVLEHEKKVFKKLKCECKQATFTRAVDENYDPTCGKCGRKL